MAKEYKFVVTYRGQPKTDTPPAWFAEKCTNFLESLALCVDLSKIEDNTESLKQP